MTNHKITVVLAKPNEIPESLELTNSVQEIMKVLGGWIGVDMIDNSILLHYNVSPKNLPYNRNLFGREIYGNAIFSKMANGRRTSLSDVEVVRYITLCSLRTIKSHN